MSDLALVVGLAVFGSISLGLFKLIERSKKVRMLRGALDQIVERGTTRPILGGLSDKDFRQYAVHTCQLVLNEHPKSPN